MFNKLYTNHWLEQPRAIREHLIKVFGIVKTGIAEIRDQDVISDGVTNNDLMVISSEKMAEYVGSVETFPRLWELTIAKAKFELNPPTMVIGQGQAGTSLQTQAQTAELTTMNNPSTPVPGGIPEAIVKFCDTCDSKGGRHLKACPKFK